ncbi:MAG TPA: diacylglycerol kinase family protein [Thiobacillaceae bacterium]|nr:diacylglycerol kinase family protein [Thiobacillaceae bacterium]
MPATSAPSPLRRFLRGFVHAARGLSAAAGERNFRFHLTAAVAVLALATSLRVSALEWALLLICVFWVLAMEAMNSALETLADRVSRDHDPLIGRAKDVAAAAVLLSALGAACVGLIILLPYLLPRLG